LTTASQLPGLPLAARTPRWALRALGGVTGLAAVAGPILGGAITQGIAWQWIFWLDVPIGLLAIPLARCRVDESYGPRAALDRG